MDAMLHEYFEKTEAGLGVPKLDMDWDFYLRMEDLDRLALIIARDRGNDELIGFNMYQLCFHPHHKTMPFAYCDIIAVKLGHRHKGVGKKLVLEAEPYLRMYNVQRVIHGFRAVYDVEPLFPRLGYELMDSNYVKAL